MDTETKQAIQLVIRKIRKDYGANCKTRDVDDFPELREAHSYLRCQSCRARDVIRFLEDYEKN